MSRALRIEYPGAFYHVMSRGNAREKVFYSNKDYGLFLDVLFDVVDRYNWYCYGYCLMPNHYHLLIETPNANLSSGMRQLNGIFTQKINYFHERVGHLFQGRYKSVLVEKQVYLGELVRYLALNPVRSGLVERPETYLWSSYARSIKGLSLLDDNLVLGLFDNDVEKAKFELQKFVNLKLPDNNFVRNLNASVILGSSEYLEFIKKYSSQIVKTVKEIKVRDRFFGRPELSEIFTDINNKKDRNNKIYQANINFGYSLTEIANHLKLHYSLMSKIIKDQRKLGSSLEL